jgi:hypothetical protein
MFASRPLPPRVNYAGAPAPLAEVAAPATVARQEMLDEIEDVCPHDHNLAKRYFEELASKYMDEISHEIRRCIALHRSASDAWAGHKIYHDAYDANNVVQRFIDNVRESSFNDEASYGPFARLQRHEREQFDKLKRHIFGTDYLRRQARDSSLYGTNRRCPHCRIAYCREAGCDNVRCGFLDWRSGDDVMQPSAKGRNGKVHGCGRRFDWSVAPSVQNEEIDNFLSSVKPMCSSKPKQVHNWPCAKGRWYHGTSWEAACAIQAKGFIASTDGCLGRGVYFARKDKASRFARNHDTPAVVEVSISFTSPKFVDGDCKTWQDEGHDACHASRTSLSANMEWCVKNPKQVQVITIYKLEVDKPAQQKAPGPALAVSPLAGSRMQRYVTSDFCPIVAGTSRERSSAYRLHCGENCAPIPQDQLQVIRSHRQPGDTDFQAVFRAYTSDDVLYKDMNKALYLDDDKGLQRFGGLIHALRLAMKDECLNKEHNVRSGTVYRKMTLKAAQSKQFVAGFHFLWPGFVSTSRRSDLDDFGTKSENDDISVNVVISLEGRGTTFAVDVSKLSKFDEEEVLIYPYSGFEVMDVEHEAGSMTLHLRTVGTGLIQPDMKNNDCPTGSFPILET